MRAAGEAWDLRKAQPYCGYEKYDFDIPTAQNSDTFDRYMVRMREGLQAARIIRQALDGIPEGPVIAKVPRNFKPPAGDVHVRVEAARGDMSWYVVSAGSEYPYRLHVRTGSFAAMSIIDRLAKGLMIADLIAVIASFDIVAPEVDR